MDGFLRNVVLDEQKGGFIADLEITRIGVTSKVLTEIHNSTEPKKMQIAIGAGAYDLIALTNRFTRPGRMPWPSIFHLGVVGEGSDPCIIDGDVNGDKVVNLEDVIIISCFWLGDCR